MKTGKIVSVVIVMMGLGAVSGQASAEVVSLLGHAGGFCAGVTVSGNYAYVSEYAGFNVLEVSNPTAPVLRGHLLLPDSADHAGRPVVSGNYVYVPWTSGVFHKKSAKAAATEGGFRVIDVSNPSAPRLVASYAAPGGVTGLAVRGNIAYVPWMVVDVNAFVFFGGLQVLDMADPTAPVLLGECSPGAGMGIVLDGNRAYVPTFYGFSIVDISSTTSPAILGTFASGAPLSVSLDLALAGSTAYFVQVKSMNLTTCTYTLEAVNVSNPATPSLLGSCQLSNFDGLVVDNISLALSGNHAFVGNNEAGLQIVDVSNSASPQLAATSLMSGEVLGIALSGSTAYLACGVAGIEVVNMANPLSPAHLGYALAGSPEKTVVSGQHVYTTWQDGFHKGAIWRHSGGIHVVSVPTMGVAAAFDVPGKAWFVDVSGDRAYVVWNNDEAGVSGIEVYNVQNPASPVRIGTCIPPHGPGSIAVKGNIVFITHGSLDILDLTDVLNPVVLVDSFLGNPPMDNLEIEGNLLYSYTSGGTTLIDVSDPHSPNPLFNASWGFYGDFSGLTMQGQTSFLVDYHALDILNGSYGNIGTFNGVQVDSVAVWGRLGYLGNPSGVTVVDLIDPAAPTVLGSYDFPGLRTKICAKDGTAYVSDNNRGLFALRYTAPFTSELREAFDSEWVRLCNLAALSPDNADVNGDGLPERWALQLIEAVLDSSAASLHVGACTAYIDNLAELDGEPTNPVVEQNRECIAALLMMGADIRDYTRNRFGLVGMYHVAENKPFSGAADPDQDGLTNAAECAAVAARGGSTDDFAQMALYHYGAGPLPVAGAGALGTMVLLLAGAGAWRMCKSRRPS